MTYSSIRPPETRTSAFRVAALVVIGVGLASLVDLGLVISGVVSWSFPAAMLAVGLLVSASMAIGFELARESARRADGGATSLHRPAGDVPLLAANRVDALLHDRLRAPAASRGRRARLDEALDHAIDALRPRIVESQAVIERGELPTVQADPIALERALTNLLQNALTHGRRSEPPRIEVRATPGQDGWVVSVSDNGPGIPAGLQDRAFEPGVRGRANEQSPGFGLGLSTVRRLIEEQGGRVWIEPATESGACVRMELRAAA